MLYENYILNNKTSFIAKLNEISFKLRAKADDLMTVFYAESRVNPQARNPKTRATGLIQFMPSTAIGLNTTVDKLYLMSNVEQLDYVYKYLKPFTGKLNNIYDLYLCVFFPAALGKSDNWVLETSTLSAELIAKSNPIIDINKNNQITVGEFKQYVDTYLKKKTC